MSDQRIGNYNPINGVTIMPNSAKVRARYAQNSETPTFGK
jgi:hypothetical protein